MDKINALSSSAAKPRAKPTGEKQKPMDATATLAGKVMGGHNATPLEQRKMAARILDDQRNDPEPHKPVPKSK